MAGFEFEGVVGNDDADARIALPRLSSGESGECIQTLLGSSSCKVKVQNLREKYLHLFWANLVWRSTLFTTTEARLGLESTCKCNWRAGRKLTLPGYSSLKSKDRKRARTTRFIKGLDFKAQICDSIICQRVLVESASAKC